MISDFWKKHGIVIASLAVIAFVVSITNLHRIFDFFQTMKNNGESALQQVRQAQQMPHSSNTINPSVSREVLTRDAVILLTNQMRADNGLPPLTENQLLNSIAESRARDMLEKQYFAHVSPAGEQASDLAQRVGYPYKIIAENIGSGDYYTNQKIVDGWMQSPGHRNNILSSEVQEIGAAVTKGNLKGTETYVTVQIFGLQSPPVAQKNCVAPPENLLRDIEMKKAELASLQEQLSRLKNELNEEKEAIETDQQYTSGNAQKIMKLNVKINAYNEKSHWYNRIAGEAKAKADVMQSMYNEYNRMLQAYNECHASH
ncbi:MAG TPA: CAP domain-containing protein [Smithella sp.]|nr:CAP domain-containing protein [Smithella sp.]MDM7988513.1 CAP domain-containing protein [Smithella sp.]HNY48950.1 CAP domain-containing protein [Smithella sp.]HOG89034.1 CAP domain-containing protein [Smithella sp.]HOU49750.1 CAP domain-containing protein [Smithella sp.]